MIELANYLIEISKDGKCWIRYTQTFKEFVSMYEEEAKERGYNYTRVKKVR
jgi:hypothetical protein